MEAINALRDPAAGPDAAARVLPLHHGPSVDVLSEDDLERIRVAVLGILEGTGIAIEGPVAERIVAAGAEVESETGRLRFPASLVREALARAPGRMLLAGRDPACDLLVDGTRAWLSTGGRTGIVVDLGTDERRASTLADLVSISRLADGQSQIGYVGPSVAALDVPAGSRSLHELSARLANTTKHAQIQLTAEDATAEALVEIARVVAGGDPSLRERPLVSAFLAIDAPLELDAGGLEAAVTLARAGIPCGFVAAPVAGASAPATVAGALVTAAAEVLAGIVSLRLLVPGAPTFFGARALRVTVPGADATPGGPQDPLFQMAWAQLARRLGIPAHLGAFATGAESSDWQAGLEGGLSGTAGWMAPPDLLAAAGTRDGGRVFSAIAMLLDTELFDLIRQVPLGFEVDEDALALEVIEKVGPGGHFLGEPHTLRHMREAWMSRFMDKDTWEAWEEKGRPEPPEHAAERVRDLLATHEPEPLETDAEEHIREVIAAHERDHR